MPENMTEKAAKALIVVLGVHAVSYDTMQQTFL